VPSALEWEHVYEDHAALVRVDLAALRDWLSITLPALSAGFALPDGHPWRVQPRTAAEIAPSARALDQLTDHALIVQNELGRWLSTITAYGLCEQQLHERSPAALLTASGQYAVNLDTAVGALLNVRTCLSEVHYHLCLAREAEANTVLRNLRYGVGRSLWNGLIDEITVHLLRPWSR
jgi:hypothetical protein